MHMQCVPVPEGLNTSSLAKHLPLTTALAATLNTDTSCTRYIPSYGQCGGSAGSCYGMDCLVCVDPPLQNFDPRIICHALTLMHKPQWHQEILQCMGRFPSPNQDSYFVLRNVAALQGVVWAPLNGQGVCWQA